MTFLNVYTTNDGEGDRESQSESDVYVHGSHSDLLLNASFLARRYIEERVPEGCEIVKMTTEVKTVDALIPTMTVALLWNEAKRTHTSMSVYTTPVY